MASPKERAEARRKALLGRGNDRLKKLTTSARGEDAPQLVHDDPPLPVPSLKSFIGESTPDIVQTPADEWSTEQFRRAMESLGATLPPQLERTSSIAASAINPSIISNENAQFQTAAIPTTMSPNPMRWSKLNLILSLLSPLFLLLYFICLYEPSLYKSYSHIGSDHWSARWSTLGIQNKTSGSRVDGVHSVPFFTVFISSLLLQQASGALFLPVESGLPQFLSMALSHAPPSIRRWVTQLMFCARIVSSILDQTSVIVFGIGSVIWIAGLVV